MCDAACTVYTLYCTVLYCTVLYCTVLYCTVLYCNTVLYCTVLYCTILYCTVLYCIAILYCTVLYCNIVLYCTALRWVPTYLSTYRPGRGERLGTLPLSRLLLRGQGQPPYRANKKDMMRVMNRINHVANVLWCMCTNCARALTKLHE